MRRYSGIFRLITIVFGVLLFTGTVLAAAQKQYYSDRAQSTPPNIPTIIRSPSPTRPAYCVPLPGVPQPLGSPSATPDPFGAVISTTSPRLGLGPSVTPRVYAHTIDLSPGIPLRDKWEIIVFRCDGTFEQFLGGPEVNIFQFLDLQAGDVILNTIPPASLMGNEPPEPPDETTTPSGTSIPYPPPIPTSVKTPTMLVYPAPVTLTPESVEP
jgi:hypothetical protein